MKPAFGRIARAGHVSLRLRLAAGGSAISFLVLGAAALLVLRALHDGGYGNVGATASAVATWRDAGFVFGLGVLWANWTLAGDMLRPIEELARTAREVAHSRDFAARASLPRRRDELARLVRAFNELLAGIEDTSGPQRRLLSESAHELRAPLTVIQGNAELLRSLSSDPVPASAVPLVEEIERHATRLNRLIDDLLLLAEMDAEIPTARDPVDLDGVVLGVLPVARRLGAGQTIRIGRFEPVAVAGDEERLRQLVLILLDNALKYSPRAGTVTVELLSRDATAELRVADDGIGIPPEDLGRVFDRFYRGRQARRHAPRGSGLGLAIAGRIVRQHRGEIEISSPSGQGTTVTIRFPSLPS